MNKYSSGSYLVKLFDKFGTCREVLKGICCCEQATKMGKAEIAKNSNYESFVVLRVIHNSKANSPYYGE